MKFMYRQLLVEVVLCFIFDIHPKSVKYFELSTGKDTKSGTK